MKHCLSCGCSELAHLSVGSRACLSSGCRCRAYVPPAETVPEGPKTWAVRVDKGEQKGSYIFKVEPMPYTKEELIALDATPGLIGMVHATDPGAAAARTWEKGCALHSTEEAQAQVPPGLGEKDQ